MAGKGMFFPLESPSMSVSQVINHQMEIMSMWHQIATRTLQTSATANLTDDQLSNNQEDVDMSDSIAQNHSKRDFILPSPSQLGLKFPASLQRMLPLARLSSSTPGLNFLKTTSAHSSSPLNGWMVQMPLTCGVPQVSIFGPWLFKLFMPQTAQSLIVAMLFITPNLPPPQCLYQWMDSCGNCAFTFYCVSNPDSNQVWTQCAVCICSRQPWPGSSLHPPAPLQCVHRIDSQIDTNAQHFLHPYVCDNISLLLSLKTVSLVLQLCTNSHPVIGSGRILMFVCFFPLSVSLSVLIGEQLKLNVIQKNNTAI